MRTPGRYVKLAHGYYNDPKITGLPPAAEIMFIRALSYCGQFSRDGFVPRPILVQLTSRNRPGSVAELLCQAGLWQAPPDGRDGYQIVAWDRWQETEDAEAQRLRSGRQRVQRHREAKKAPVDPSPVTRYNTVSNTTDKDKDKDPPPLVEVGDHAREAGPGGGGHPEPQKAPTHHEHPGPPAGGPQPTDDTTPGHDDAHAILTHCGKVWGLGKQTQTRHHAAILRALNGGWTAPQLTTELTRNPEGSRAPEAVFAARIADLRDPPHRRPTKPLWCGHCDPHTRLIETHATTDTVRRCPTCHPLAPRPHLRAVG